MVLSAEDFGVNGVEGGVLLGSVVASPRNVLHTSGETALGLNYSHWRNDSCHHWAWVGGEVLPTEQTGFW
jgi:hypothetical protein